MKVEYKRGIEGAGEMVQMVKSTYYSCRGPGSIPSTHMVIYTHQ